MVEQREGRRYDGVGVRVPGGHERDQQRRLQVILDRPVWHTSPVVRSLDVIVNQTQI